jgi:hypothetical protein
MAITELERHSLLEEQSYPYASPSSDGGESAYNAVAGRQNMPVPFRIGSARNFSDLVDDYISILEQRKLQTTARREKFEVSLKVGLRGWDFADLQEKNYEFYESELPASFVENRPIWWKLFKKSNILVIFGRNIGCPIRCAAVQGQATCDSWADIPINEYLLLASMIPLLRLKAFTCKNTSRSRGRYMLTKKYAWYRPAGSRVFDNYTEGSICNPIQTLSLVYMVTNWVHRGGHPGNIEKTGAVLFAHHPTKFPPRRCHFNQLPPPPAAQAQPLPQLPPPVASWRVFFISLMVIYFISGCIISQAAALAYRWVWIPMKMKLPMLGHGI